MEDGERIDQNFSRILPKAAREICKVSFDFDGIDGEGCVDTFLVFPWRGYEYEWILLVWSHDSWDVDWSACAGCWGFRDPEKSAKMMIRALIFDWSSRGRFGEVGYVPLSYIEQISWIFSD